jgi:hypothetical protein
MTKKKPKKIAKPNQIALRKPLGIRAQTKPLTYPAALREFLAGRGNRIDQQIAYFDKLAKYILSHKEDCITIVCHTITTPRKYFWIKQIPLSDLGSNSLSFLKKAYDAVIPDSQGTDQTARETGNVASEPKVSTKQTSSLKKVRTLKTSDSQSVNDRFRQNTRSQASIRSRKAADITGAGHSTDLD